MRLIASIIACFICLTYALFAQERLVILGGGPAGYTAAIYAARAGLSPLVLEGEEPGGQIALSYTVDNFPGFPEGINGYALATLMRDQAARFGARIKESTVLSVDLSYRPFTLRLSDGRTVTTETLIIATGASAKWLGLDSEQALIGRGVSSCAVCDGLLFTNKEVVVVGGGDTALEDALFLANYASQVTVVHRRDTLRASPYLQQKAFAHPNIHFVWNSEVVQIEDPEEGKVTGVAIRHVFTHEIRYLPTQGVFVAIGHQPNTDLFKNQIHLDRNSYIQTRQGSTHTTIPGVFAAGDVADPHYRQAVTAAGTGSMAAMDAYHFLNNPTEE